MQRIFEDLIETVSAMGFTDDYYQKVSDLIEEKVPHYDWVGFYMIDPGDKSMLDLVAFRGEDTEHVRIPVGEGICGQAAARKESFVIQDVHKESNYLSCSPKVNSEIVVPIFVDYEVVGEVDVDSHDRGVFTDDDRLFLEKIAEITGDKIKGA